MRFGQRLCHFGQPDEVCLRCGTRETLPVKRPKPLRKREVSQRTKMLFELQQPERTGAPRIYSGNRRIQSRRLQTLRAQSYRRHRRGIIRWKHAFSDKADSYRAYSPTKIDALAATHRRAPPTGDQLRRPHNC